MDTKNCQSSTPVKRIYLNNEIDDLEEDIDTFQKVTSKAKSVKISKIDEVDDLDDDLDLDTVPGVSKEQIEIAEKIDYEINEEIKKNQEEERKPLTQAQKKAALKKAINDKRKARSTGSVPVPKCVSTLLKTPGVSEMMASMMENGQLKKMVGAVSKSQAGGSAKVNSSNVEKVLSSLVNK